MSLKTSHPREYNSWKAMISRCYKCKTASFKYCGGRGVTVYDRWRHSFAAFLEDMGPRPPGTSLDRFPDNCGNYEPGNCRWATPKQQSRNRTDNTFVGGVLLADAADDTGIKTGTIRARVRQFGWTPEQALAIKPVMGHRPVQAMRKQTGPLAPRIGPSPRNHSSGVYGVTWHKLRHKWSARLRHQDRYIYLGYYATKEEAVEAVRRKQAEIGGMAHAG